MPNSKSQTTKRTGLKIIEALMDATDEEDVYRGLIRELRDPTKAEKIIAAVEAASANWPI